MSVAGQGYSQAPIPTSGLFPGRALPGWFEGHTRCDVSMRAPRWNSASITDETTGAVVATSGTPNCGIQSSTFCHAYAPGGRFPLLSGSVFIPASGHSYRGDYNVQLRAPEGLIWVDWDARYCTVGSTQAVLTCNYYSRYSTIGALSPGSIRPSVAPALAPSHG